MVLAYREQYLIERSFSRLKGCPLGLLPLYWQDDQRVCGLIHWLTIGLRLLGLVEWVVAQALARGEDEDERVLRGVYAGQAGRATARPSPELLLRAFRGLTLLVQGVGGQVRAWLQPLNHVQQRILKLLGFSSDIYQRLVQHCLNPVPI